MIIKVKKDEFCFSIEMTEKESNNDNTIRCVNNILGIFKDIMDTNNLSSVNNNVIDFVSPLTAEINLKLETIKKIDSDLTGLTSQLNRAYNLLEQGVYSVDIFKERQQNLNSSISALKEQKTQTESDLKHFYDLQETQERFAPKVRHLLDTYYSNTVDVNNEILRDLIDRITYEKNEKNTRGKLENCNFELHIYPKIPF